MQHVVAAPKVVAALREVRVVDAGRKLFGRPR
jgi:hypothetical protein